MIVLLSSSVTSAFAVARAGALPLLAYIGPGSGLMGIVLFVGALAAIVVAFVGFVWFPVKRLLRRVRGATHVEPGQEPEPDAEQR